MRHFARLAQIPFDFAQGRLSRRKERLFRMTSKMQRYPTSPCESVLLARDWPEGVQVGGAAEDSAVVRDFGGGGIEAVDLDVVGTG